MALAHSMSYITHDRTRLRMISCPNIAKFEVCLHYIRLNFRVLFVYFKYPIRTPIAEAIFDQQTIVVQQYI